jgi:hypothetical protein
MQFDALVKMNHTIFSKMKNWYAEGRFGYPTVLGIHVGCGLDKYCYQSLPVDHEMAKMLFVAMHRVIIQEHQCDWAIITMDAFQTKIKPGAVDEEMRLKLNLDLLIKAGLAERISCVTQIAQSKSGAVHVLSAPEIAKNTLGDTVDEKYHEDEMIHMVGNMMLFRPAQPHMQKIIDVAGDKMKVGARMVPFTVVS